MKRDQLIALTKNGIESLFSVTFYEKEIRSRRINEYTLFMMHYYRCHKDEQKTSNLNIIEYEDDESLISSEKQSPINIRRQLTKS